MTDAKISPPPFAPPPELLDRVRGTMRLKNYSPRTEEAYVGWIARYIRFHNRRHPKEMGTAEIEAFLTDLAMRGQVSASTQNQAFSALLFLYQVILEIALPRIDHLRARRPERLPVVLAVDEIRIVLAGLDGIYALMANLMYGSGLRLLECCRLRVKDVDFARNQIVVRQGKGDKDRVVPLPQRLLPALKDQIEAVRKLHAAESSAYR